MQFSPLSGSIPGTPSFSGTGSFPMPRGQLSPRHGVGSSPARGADIQAAINVLMELTPGTPRSPSFPTGERFWGRQTPDRPTPDAKLPRPPSLPRTSRARGTSATISSPCHIKAASSMSMARSPSHNSFSDCPPVVAEVVYDPRNKKQSSESFAPPLLQQRETSRCMSADSSFRTASFRGGHPSAKIAESLRPKAQPSSLIGDTDYILIKAGRQADDTMLRRNLSAEDIVGPSWLAFSPQRTSNSSNFSLGGKVTGRPRKQSRTAAARARSKNSLFWQPPPGAAELCEAERSPSFLLHTQAEVMSDSERVVREGTDGSELGASSSQAVAAAVCEALGNNLLAKTPSYSHFGPTRRTRAGIASVPVQYRSQAVPAVSFGKSMFEPPR